MSQNGTVHSTLIYKINVLSCQIVQSVKINSFLAHHDLILTGFYFQNGLIHDSGTILNELTHRMKVCCQIY